MESGKPAWEIHSDGEARVLDELLRRRFPDTVPFLVDALADADPMALVYPGQDRTYTAVVREMVTLLATRDDDLTTLTIDDLTTLVTTALTRCFPQRPDEEEIAEAARLIHIRATNRRFWHTETQAEARVVDELLRRRYPDAMGIVAAALEQADPMEVVYPGNPGEYAAVVRETVTLLATRDDDLTTLTIDDLTTLVTTALTRCFAEPPPGGRARQVAHLIRAEVANRER